MPRRDLVAVGQTKPEYCNEAPFHPGEHYPEMPFAQTSSGPNGPYALLRRLLRNLDLDREHFDSAEWNPFGSIIAPGQTVVIKPNLVLDRNESGGDPFAVVTHPSIIRALVDYTFLALAGKGRIVIADAPMMTCDWDRMMKLERLDAIQQFYREQFGFAIEVYDLRPFALIDTAKSAYSDNRKSLPGDPLGSVTIDLGSDSLLAALDSDRFYGADYDRAQTIAQHHGTVHRYRISKTILTADTVISVPKMKTHKKVGVTLNAKGLVGINTDKNCLVHYRVGTPRQGGDQLPDSVDNADRAVIGLQRWCYDHLLAEGSPVLNNVYRCLLSAYRALIKPLRSVKRQTAAQDSGNWYGNDSAWRMTADLQRIVLFAAANGRIESTPQRKLFCVVDGIIGGEKEGPLAPTAFPSGLMTAGEDPVSVDLITTRAMGIDPERLKQFSPAYDISSPLFRDPGGIEMRGEIRFPPAAFQPHFGWVGHIELKAQPAELEMAR